MQLTPVNSSMISAVGYDEETQELQVQFSNGQVYAYDGVDPSDGNGLVSASSPGQFFHQNIKDSYAGVPV